MAKMHKKAKQALRLLMEQFNDSEDAGMVGALPVGIVREAGGTLAVPRRLFAVTFTADVIDTATGEPAGRQTRTYLAAAKDEHAARGLVKDAVYQDPQVTDISDETVTVVQLTGHVYLASADGAGSIVPPQPAQPVPAEAPTAADLDGPHAHNGPQLVADDGETPEQEGSGEL